MTPSPDPREEPAVPSPGGALKAPDRLPPEVMAEIRNALVEARLAADQRANAAPLRELAAAFQQNAEALRAVQETQERIARSVDRTDRTEAVIQSTQALNDTFRGVRAAQDALVNRLEREERKPLRYGLLAALLVAATAGAAGFLLLNREDDLRGRIEELRAGIETQDRDSWEASRRAAEGELLDRIESLSKQTSLTEAERGVKERELLERGNELEQLRREGEAEVARRGRLEGELDRLRRENETLRAEAASSRKAAEEAARKLAEARSAATAAATAALSRPTEGPPASAPPPVEAATPAGTAEKVAAPLPPPLLPGLGPQAVTDAGQVRKVLDDLNALLVGAGGRDLYKVTEAKAVDGDRLVSVRLESRGPDGTLRRSFEAAEARFVLLAASRSLEIRLRSGSVTYLGRRTVRFLEDEHTAYLEVDPAPFRASGNPLVVLR